METAIRQHKGKTMRLIVAAVAALISSACSASATGEERSSSKATKVTLAVPAPSELFNLPVVLANQLGYFSDEGLDVKLVDVGAGTNGLQAVLAGEAQAASGFAGHSITMAAKGQAVRSFVTTMNSPGMALVVSPATRRSIATVEDLRGAVVGVSAPGSGTHHLLNYVLHQHGLSPDDVSVAGIGLSGTAVAAMENGKVDASVMLEPALSQLQKRTGDLRFLVDTRTTEGVTEVFGTKDYPAIALYARSTWLAKNSKTARGLAAAVTRALRWARQHEAGEIADKMPAEYASGDRALYEATIATAKPTISPDGRMHPEGAEALRKMLSVSVPEARDTDINLVDTYTNEFL